MKKRLTILCLLLTMIFVFPSCTSKLGRDNGSNSTIKYDEYISLFHKMNKLMKLPNYKNLGNNENTRIVAIDKELSFGKRSYLTLDNQQSDLTTQHRIEYRNDNGKSMAAIDLIYLDKPLNNDMVYCNDPLDNKGNAFVKNAFDEDIISYKNILIKISVFAIDSNKIDASTLMDISTVVVDYIQRMEKN